MFSKQQKRPCLSSSRIQFCQRNILRNYFPFVWSNFSRLIPTDIIPANMIDLANLLRKDISLKMEIKTCKLDSDVSACSCVHFLFLPCSDSVCWDVYRQQTKSVTPHLWQPHPRQVKKKQLKAKILWSSFRTFDYLRLRKSFKGRVHPKLILHLYFVDSGSGDIFKFI